MRRTTIAALFAVIMLVLMPSVANAQGTYLDQAVAGIKQAPVFVATGTEGTTLATAQSLTNDLTSTDHIVVVMLPSAAAAEDTADNFATKLDDATKHRYIVAVSVGNKVASATNLLPADVAPDLMRRASQVSTSTVETLQTFVHSVHNYQTANPGQVKSPPPPETTGEPATPANRGGFPWSVVLLGGAVLLSGLVGLVALALRSRGRSAAEEQVNPSVKIETPKRIRDELEALLAIRRSIDEQNMRDTVTQLVRDVNVIFEKMRRDGATTEQIDDACAQIERQLQDLLENLNQFVEIQNGKRYYPNWARDLQDGLEALNDYAEYTLREAQLAGAKRLNRYKVNNKILSAQKY